MKNPKPWKGSRHEDVRLLLPRQFLMLCKLFDIRPQQVLHDFMNSISMESFGTATDNKDMIIEYFIQRGYGQAYYTHEDIRTILKELNAIGTLWPAQASINVIEQHDAWRSMYYKYWFKKWRKKPRRN